MSTEKFQVGQQVWVRDENNRVYADHAAAYAAAGVFRTPDYRKYFIVCTITKITPKTLYIDRGYKAVDRQTMQVKGDRGWKVFTSSQAMEDDIFRHDHINEIIDAVRRADVPTLRKIAELVEGK